jgi:hypothetical protein
VGLTCTSRPVFWGVHKRYLKLPPEHLTLHSHLLVYPPHLYYFLLFTLLLQLPSPQRQCPVQLTSMMTSSALRPLLVSRLERRKPWRNTNSSVSTFEFVFTRDFCLCLMVARFFCICVSARGQGNLHMAPGPGLSSTCCHDFTSGVAHVLAQRNNGVI